MLLKGQAQGLSLTPGQGNQRNTRAARREAAAAGSSINRFQGQLSAAPGVMPVVIVPAEGQPLVQFPGRRRGFEGGEVRFEAFFSGGEVSFVGTEFTSGTVSLDGCQYSGGKVGFIPGDWSRPPKFTFDWEHPPPGVTLPSEAHLRELERH